MLSPRGVLGFLALAACAPAMTAAEHDAPYLAARAAETKACDGACCGRLVADLAAARAKGDDRATDEAIERLALACPFQRAGLLDPSFEPERPNHRDRLMMSVAYELRLPAEDQVTWAATYLDGTSRTLAPWPGPHTVTVDLHVLAGRDPDKGRLVRLTQTVPLEPVRRRWRGVVVRVTRHEGADPFVLEVIPTNDSTTHKFYSVSPGSERGEGTIGLGNLGTIGGKLGDGAREAEIPHYERPDWKMTPVFYPPSELLLAGAPSEGFANCVGPGGELLNSAVQRSWRPPHPRLMGAALDWLRRFEYEKPDWAWQVSCVCEPFDVAFYRSPAREPSPQEHGVEAKFQYDHPPPR